jgi:hypothetical protein
MIYLMAAGNFFSNLKSLGSLNKKKFFSVLIGFIVAYLAIVASTANFRYPERCMKVNFFVAAYSTVAQIK